MGRIAGRAAEDTRRRLIEAAAAEFEERGFEGTRVSDIAARAGVSNGALYRHFASKQELLACALAQIGRREIDSLLPGADGESIANLLGTVGRSLDRMPPGKGGLIIEALVAARRDPAIARLAGDHLAGGEAWITGLLEAAQAAGRLDPTVDARAAARLCEMLLLGALLVAPARLGPVDPDGWDRLISGLLASVSAPEQAAAP